MGKKKKLRKRCQLLELQLQELELKQRIHDIQKQPVPVMGFHKNTERN